MLWSLNAATASMLYLAEYATAFPDLLINLNEIEIYKRQLPNSVPPFPSVTLCVSIWYPNALQSPPAIGVNTQRAPVLAWRVRAFINVHLVKGKTWFKHWIENSSF
jgi:hypothetical protein